MTIRDKLIEILLKADRECDYLEQEQEFPCEGCEYRTLDRSIRGCIFDKYADAIIESGLFCDTSKLPEDSIVLSGEEFESLYTQEQYDKVYEQAEDDVLANMSDGGTSCHFVEVEE